ncbi:MAG TPA: exodeoxyribonuclease VII large subunit [Nitrospinae bacterium]|nr:exodeoxyribonuclease VII large subunit [Nitrospinota bacterium]
MSMNQEREIYTVSELTHAIKFVLEEDFPEVWVEGEISNFRVPSSGHAYFTLKDKDSQLKVVLFKLNKRLLKFEPEDGLHVIVRGRISIYESRGEYQLIADYMEPKGIGALQLAFEQLKEKLLKEGIFDEAHKIPIPQFPQKIAIVTSPTGAAIRDMLRIIDRRFSNVHIIIYPVKVQGEGASIEIAHAIKELNELSHGEPAEPIDVMIVGRGGGSIEDLWSFNEEIVARAIYDSKIPVISAVGHEIDYTIADFVADLRAPTPSAAAELVVKDKREVVQNIIGLEKRLINAVQNMIDILKSDLTGLQERRVLKSPLDKIYELQQKTDDMGLRVSRSPLLIYKKFKERTFHLSRSLFILNPEVRIRRIKEILSELTKGLETTIGHRMEMFDKRLQGELGRLNALSPLSVMERGYSICRRMPDMKIIKNSTEVEKGGQVNVRLHKGELICRVEEQKH